MNDAARARLLASARHLLDAEPWATLDDVDLFGIEDRTSGRIACVSVMGSAGVEHGVIILLGESGFDLLRKIVESETDPANLMARAEGFSLTLETREPEPEDAPVATGYLLDQRRIRTTGGLVGRVQTWKMLPGRYPRPVDGEDAGFLVRCLEAIAELASSGALGSVVADGPTESDRYPFFEVPDSGCVDPVPTPRLVARGVTDPPPVPLTPGARERIARRPRHEGAYYLTVFPPPARVGADGTVWAAILYQPERDRILAASMSETFDGACASVLEMLDGQHAAPEAPRVRRPDWIWTDSYPAYQAIKDSLAELRIQSGCREAIGVLHDLRRSLADHLRGA